MNEIKKFVRFLEVGCVRVSLVIMVESPPEIFRIRSDFEDWSYPNITSCRLTNDEKRDLTGISWS